MPLNHRFRKNRKDFFVDRVEKDVASPHLSGEELHHVVSEYGDIVFGLQSGKQKFPGFGLTHNWELPYWKTNLLRHNLDIMHDCASKVSLSLLFYICIYCFYLGFYNK